MPGYNVRSFDSIEIIYTENNNLQKYIPPYLESAKEFVKTADDKNYKIESISIFFTITIEPPNGNPFEPHKRFAEHIFTADEFLHISHQWIKSLEPILNKEIDNYMQERFGTSPVQ